MPLPKSLESNHPLMDIGSSHVVLLYTLHSSRATLRITTILVDMNRHTPRSIPVRQVSSITSSRTHNSIFDAVP